jgi:hypothetical protein
MDLKAYVKTIDASRFHCCWTPDWKTAHAAGEYRTETMTCASGVYEIRVMLGSAMVLGFDMRRSAEPRADAVVYEICRHLLLYQIIS